MLNICLYQRQYNMKISMLGDKTCLLCVFKGYVIFLL